MNLLKNLCNSISSLYKYFLDKYTFKNIKLYIVKSSPYGHEFIHEHIIMIEFGSFNNRP